MTSIPLSLYIHIPWCVKKCPYCDFNSHQKPTDLPEKAYIARLIQEVENKKNLVGNRSIQTIFIGGGTPSLFQPESYAVLFEALRQHLNISPTAEITLEANPGTVEQQRFKGFFELGINRISLGIQSFQDEKLRALGRIHSATESMHAIEAVKAAGFTNFNLDLMYGLPTQSIEDGLSDLKTALRFQPPHLSWYHLTLEPNTPFYKFPPSLPKDELVWDLQDQGEKLLAEHGYEHYEISAFSQPEKQARHNVNYWQFGDYLGIGAGAHGKITQAEPFSILRQANVAAPRAYLNAENIVQSEHVVSQKEIALEFFMNAFRLSRPIFWKDFFARTQLKKEDVKIPLEKALQNQWITFDSEKISTTTLGRRFLNELLKLF